MDYPYRPLATPTQIRVIALFPHPPLPDQISPDNPEAIKCTLSHVDLKDQAKYEALSYVWGASHSRRQIDLDGVPVNVTDNLYSALVHLRRQPTTSGDANPFAVLWADALCINQNDLAEKAQQIPLMRDIYGGCMGVLVWLGEETPDVQGSLALAEMLTRSPRGCAVPPPHDQSWVRLFELFRRPWFRRVWVIQELALAPRALMICGHTRQLWRSLVGVLEVAESMDINVEGMYGDQAVLKIVRHLENSRKQAEKGHFRSLLKLMTRYRDCLSTHPRDKIFALFGIASRHSTERLRLGLSYDVSVQDLYIDFARRTLTGKNLDLFQMLGPPRLPELQGLPSWVPDWTASSKGEIFPPLRHRELPLAEWATLVGVEHDEEYLATGKTTASPRFQTLDGTHLLCLEGHVIGVLELVAGYVNRNSQPPSNPLMWAPMIYGHFRGLGEWEAVARARAAAPYWNGELMLACYWQVLTGGWKPDGFRDTNSEFLEFDFALRTARWLMLVAWPLPFLHRLLPFQLLVLMLTTLVLVVTRRPVMESARFMGYCGASLGRKMAATPKYIGLVPKEALQKDSVVLLKGGKVPLIIRRESGPAGTDVWRLIGEAYIHGVMGGQAFVEKDCQCFWFV
jgi:hypothetical protein